MRKIFGGEHPEILDRLQPLLDSFAANLDKKANAGTGELLAKAAKQFGVERRSRRGQRVVSVG